VWIQPCNSLRDYLLYVAFFPQLVAGPIVRAADLLPQLGKKAWASVRDVEVGLAQFGIGAVKKRFLDVFGGNGWGDWVEWGWLWRHLKRHSRSCWGLVRVGE